MLASSKKSYSSRREKAAPVPLVENVPNRPAPGKIVPVKSQSKSQPKPTVAQKTTTKAALKREQELKEQKRLEELYKEKNAVFAAADEWQIEEVTKTPSPIRPKVVPRKISNNNPTKPRKRIREFSLLELDIGDDPFTSSTSTQNTGDKLPSEDSFFDTPFMLLASSNTEQNLDSSMLMESVDHSETPSSLNPNDMVIETEEITNTKRKSISQKTPQIKNKSKKNQKELNFDFMNESIEEEKNQNDNFSDELKNAYGIYKENAIKGNAKIILTIEQYQSVWIIGGRK